MLLDTHSWVEGWTIFPAVHSPFYLHWAALVSMSTLQTGHSLLVVSQLSTQLTWNKCIHANLLTFSPDWKSVIKNHEAEILQSIDTCETNDTSSRVLVISLRVHSDNSVVSVSEGREVNSTGGQSCVWDTQSPPRISSDLLKIS